MKGIISAYSCLPNKGSEDGLGWNTLLSAAKVLEKVYLVTKKSNADKIEKWKEQNVDMLKNVEFVYIDIPYFIRKLSGHIGQIVRYEYFQRKLIDEVKNVVDGDKIDFCQHVTWASFVRKNYLYKLGIPVILGPVGGGEMIPEQIDYTLSLKERITEWLRHSAVRKVSTSKIHKKMFDSAAMILTTTKESKMMIPQKYHDKIIVEQAIGINRADYEKRIEPNNGKFIVLMSGRMLYWLRQYLLHQGSDNSCVQSKYPVFLYRPQTSSHLPLIIAFQINFVFVCQYLPNSLFGSCRSL